MLMAQGLGVFSSLGIGIIAEYVGVPQTLFFAAFIELAILIYLWMFTSLPNVEKQLGIIKDEDSLKITKEIPLYDQPLNIE